MHQLVTVIASTQAEAEELLEEYAEDLEVAPYVELTRDEWMRVEHAWRSQYQQSHPTDEENNRILTMSDNQLLAYKREHAEENGEQYDETGNRVSTFNPQAHWDYYTFGGRWDSIVHELQGMDAHVFFNKHYVETSAIVSEQYGWDETSERPLLDDDDRVWFYDCHQ